MARKTLVGYCELCKHDGQRTYAVFDIATGQIHSMVTVNDCGHGAKMAHDHITERFRIATSDKAYRACQELVSRYEKYYADKNFKDMGKLKWAMNERTMEA